MTGNACLAPVVMQLPDVNVLIYAHRADAPEHDRYADWFQALTASVEPFALADSVLASFLRIVTNPRIFNPPTPMDTALASASAWSLASRVAPHAKPSALDVFVNLCSGIKGPLVADAYVAAWAIDHGCELITTDSDFARFRGLRWRHPLAAPGRANEGCHRSCG